MTTEIPKGPQRDNWIHILDEEPLRVGQSAWLGLTLWIRIDYHAYWIDQEETMCLLLSILGIKHTSASEIEITPNLNAAISQRPKNRLPICAGIIRVLLNE